MIAAVPVFGSRVAPRFSHCDALVLARVAAGQATPLEELNTATMTEDERIKLLEDRQVTLLACGGIDRELMGELEERGIRVIHNVAGETDRILSRLAQGDLRPGYGLSVKPEDDRRAPTDGDHADLRLSATQSVIDCMSCRERHCLHGRVCPMRNAFPSATLTGNLHQLGEVAADIAAEPERVLCRIAELVYFALDMKYKRLGLAFCADLFDEAEVVAQLLRRFFHVTPVCCKIGGLVDPDDTTAPTPGPQCNPSAQARILNEARTDLNVLMGPCMGADVILTQLSLAPVTVLVVKDRLLAHNPVAAVHSRYVLQNILGRS